MSAKTPHPLSHYNSIIELCARFLLSLIKDLSIDFPSHFILSLIDVNRDRATRDKLFFPSAIMQIIRHLSIPIPQSPHFVVIGANSAASVWRNEAQLRPKRPKIETMDSPAPSIPSTSAHSSSSVGDVTLEAVMAQLQCMDARLDTLTTELYQVNTHVGRIAWRQAHLGGFVASPSPSLKASEDEDVDDEDEDASSFGDDETTS